MTHYDIMYIISEVVGIACLAIVQDPDMSGKTRFSVVCLLLTGLAVAAYLVLGNTPVPENPMFPIQLKLP